MTWALIGLGILASALLLYAVVVELNDLPRCERGQGWAVRLRHHLRAIGLVLIGAGAGMHAFRLLAGLPLDLLSLALVLGVSLIYLSRSPEWLRYLVCGDRRHPSAAAHADRRAP